MSAAQPIILSRDCNAVQIPNGGAVQLKAGTRVRITQSLGGTYTVMTEDGIMARIAAGDADAVGEKPKNQEPVQPGKGPASKEELEKWVMGQLRTVFDPEIPVNVVDLGLVYACELKPFPEDPSQYDVQIKMTLTAPGCGMGSVLKADAEQKILKLPGVGRAGVEMVVDPPWNSGRMSEAAKLQLGML